MEPYSKDTTLRDYLRIIFKHKYLIIITVIPVMIINYVIAEFNTTTYDASVKVVVSGTKRTEATYYKELSRNPKLVSDHAALVSSRQVITPVVMALKLYELPDDYEKNFASPLKRLWIDYMLKQRERVKRNNPDRLDPEKEKAIRINSAVLGLSSRVGVQPVEESNMFLIKIRDFDPVRAAIIANSVSRSYVIFDLQQQLSELKLKYGEKYSTVIQIQAFIEELKKTLDGNPLSDMETLLPASVKIVEQAEVPDEPAEIKSKTGVLAVSFLGGLMLGVVLSLVTGFYDQRFKSPLELETFLKIPLLGSIPKVKKENKLLTEETKESSNYTKAFHNIAEQLYLLIRDKQLKTILVTGIESSKEIPVITANLAAYIGKKTNKNVLIINANLRTPGTIQAFNIPNSYGLGEVLEGKLGFEDAIHDIDGTISVLPAGNPTLNPLNLVTSSNMAAVIKKVSEIYEMVFVICDGLNDYQDAVVISSMLDGVVLVVNEEKDRKPVVKFAINPMEQRKANMLGAILNNRTYVIPDIVYRLT